MTPEARQREAREIAVRRMRQRAREWGRTRDIDDPVPVDPAWVLIEGRTLSAAQLGAVIRLRCAMWRSGGRLALVDRPLRLLAGLDRQAWAASRERILGFFLVVADADGESLVWPGEAPTASRTSTRARARPA